MARADFGRTEVDGVLTAIGKVAVALAARDGDDDGDKCCFLTKVVLFFNIRIHVHINAF